MKTNSNEFALEASSTFNEIGYNVAATVDRDQVTKLANIGLEKLVGAKPSSIADQVLSGGWNPKQSKDVKRGEWKRNSIPFSDSNAAKLGELFTEYLAKEHGITAVVNTAKYTPASIKVVVDPTLTAKAVLAQFQMLGAEFVAQFAKRVGYEGDNLAEDNAEFISAIVRSNSELNKLNS
jgi:uncharacterized protein with GYD domain